MSHQIFSLLLLLTISGCAASENRDEPPASQTGIESLNTHAPSLFTLGDVPPDAIPPSDSIGCDKQPSVIENPVPDYPEELRTAKVQGVVWVKIWVSKDGTVKQARVIKSSNQKLNKLAAETGMRWLFKPGETKGKPVDAWIFIPFKWKLSEQQ
jgi:TonB family protein